MIEQGYKTISLPDPDALAAFGSKGKGLRPSR
jgi:hypothetical protein